MAKTIKWFLIVIGVAVAGAAVIISLSIFFSDAALSRPSTKSLADPAQDQKQSHIATCPKTLDMDPRTPSYNKTAVECVQRLIEACQPGNDIYLTYNFGSLAISIQGIKNNANCSLKLVHEIEMGKNTYYCIVPSGEMAKWQSWRNAGGGDATKDVSSYCKDPAGNEINNS
jgi:hypothetical protein